MKLMSIEQPYLRTIGNCTCRFRKKVACACNRFIYLFNFIMSLSIKREVSSIRYASLGKTVSLRSLVNFVISALKSDRFIDKKNSHSYCFLVIQHRFLTRGLRLYNTLLKWNKRNRLIFSLVDADELIHRWITLASCSRQSYCEKLIRPIT